MATAPLKNVLRSLHGLSNAPGAGELSDRELLERFAACRDESAFAALVRRHGLLVWRVSFCVLRQVQDAEDAFQATFLVLARKASALRWGESVSGWLHEAAYRIAMKARAEAIRRCERQRQLEERMKPEPAPSANWQELRGILDEELCRLPSKYRLPLLCCYLEGHTQDEAARRLGWSERTLRRRLDQGRQRLRERLTRRGITLSAALFTMALTRPTASAAVPATLTLATVKAAADWSAGGISAKVAALMEGTAPALFTFPIKMVALLVLLSSGILAAASIGQQMAAVAQLEAAEEHSPTQAVQSPDKPAAEEPAPVRRDFYGDPLPERVVARLGTERLRHGSPVFSVAFSPDGKTLASGSQDNTLRLWKVADGKELLRIEDDLGDKAGFLGTDSIYRVAFAPDGKTLAATSLNYPLRLWDVTTGKLRRRFDTQVRQSLWLAFSPDGKTLAYDGRDRTIRLAEVATGKEVLRLNGSDKEDVQCIAFSPDGRTLASGGDGTVVRLWDVAAGTELRTLAGHPKGVRSLVFSPDSRTLVTGGGDKAIRFWDAPSGKPLRTLAVEDKGEAGPLLVLSPDGKLLVSGHDRLVRFWDTATGKELHRFQVSWYHINSLSLSPDGKMLATGNMDNNAVRLWEVPTGKPLLHQEVPQEGLRAVAFSPDGRTLATGCYDDQIRVWEAETGQELHRFPTRGRIAFTPDGKTLVGGGWDDGKLHFWELATGRERRCFQAHEGWIPRMVVAPDGKTLVSLGGRDGMVRLWNLATGREVHHFGGKQKSFVTWVALTPDGKTLATLHQDEKALRLWDVATGRERHHLVGHPYAIASIAIAPDGHTLASGGYDGTLYLWEVGTGKECWHGKIGSSLDEMAFAPDGNTLAWGSQHEKTVHLWEVRTRQERCRFHGHQGPVTGLAFSADNTRLASTSNDGTALVWDLTGGLRDGEARRFGLATEDLEHLASDLGSSDAAKAYRAMDLLSRSPGQAVALLRKHLPPVAATDAKRLARLLADLDSDQFTVREKAATELEQLGDAAEPSLRRALGDRPSVEVRRRLTELLAKGEAGRLHASRAIEVLERPGTAEARQRLEELAKGAPGAWLTNEAKAARDRMTKRAASKR
jgi:RNA polymerase sigma factor (sigma-70 family)